MITRLGNLLFASFALLIIVIGQLGCRSALSSSEPRPPQFPDSISGVLMGLVALVWFVSAVGLFFRKRLAWVASLAGVAVAMCFAATGLAVIGWLFLFPDAHMEKLKSYGSPGYILSAVTALGEFAGVLALLSAIFIGLLKMRKELK